MLEETSWISAGASVAISKRARTSYWACRDVKDFCYKVPSRIWLWHLWVPSRVQVAFPFPFKAISRQGKLLLSSLFLLPTCILPPTKEHVKALLNDDNIHSLLFLTESTMKLNSGSPRREPVTCQYFLSDLFISHDFSCVSLVACCRQQNFFSESLVTNSIFLWTGLLSRLTLFVQSLRFL